MIEKTTSATSTAVAKKSSTKASQLLWPIQGNVKATLEERAVRLDDRRRAGR